MLRRIILGMSFMFITCAYADANHLSQSFVSNSYHYAILFPSGWKYVDNGKGTVVFRNNDNKQMPLMINIQTLLTKKGGGEYATVNDLMNDFWTQVPQHTQHAQFLDRRPVTLVEPNGMRLLGEETTLTFYENHQTYKQWQIMTISHDGMLFQAWAYRAPETIFVANLPLATAILHSWITK